KVEGVPALIQQWELSSDDTLDPVVKLCWMRLVCCIYLMLFN
ncbi:unnamed protein product, partial [Urochloa humidicola]